MSHRIVFLDRDTLGPGVELRRPAFQHDWVDFPATDASRVPQRLAAASIAVVNKVRLSRGVLAALPDLRLVAVSATGTDNVDRDACRDLGIGLVNVRGYAGTTVPEHTFALILALRRGIVGYRDDVRDGVWSRAGSFCLFTRPIADLRGSRLGIIGAGELGRAVAVMARAFGMEVRFATHRGAGGRDSLPLPTLLAESDVISLHCPLTEANRNLIAMPQFRQMRRRPILINTARGGLVNETDLADALRAGLISGAGLDVLAREPPPRDYPLLSCLGSTNLIITPHVAWASLEARQRLADILIDRIEAFVRDPDTARLQ